MCDCPITHYWDSTSSTCVIRVSHHAGCTNDYNCLSGVGLSCQTFFGVKTCECISHMQKYSFFFYLRVLIIVFKYYLLILNYKYQKYKKKI